MSRCLWAGALLAGLGCAAEESGCKSAADCPAGLDCRAGTCARGSLTGGDGGPDGGDSDTGGPPTPVGDGLAPEVSITFPYAYAVLSGIIDIDVEVEDPGLVAIESVSARLADQYDVPLERLSMTRYTGQFDTDRVSPRLLVSLVVSAVNADGRLGSAGLSFALDNEPPAIALESALMQMARQNEDEQWECSQQFDPLGGSAIRHDDQVRQTSPYGLLFYPRARIEDIGNAYATGNAWYPLSGVDDETTWLYILDSTALAAGRRLAVGEGFGTRCRGIDPAAEPNPTGREPDQAIVQRLVPVPVAGVPDFSAGAPVSPGCALSGNDAETPDPICEAGTASDITYWLGSATVPTFPAVYVLNAYAADAPAVCTGGAFDARNLADGRACLVAVAADIRGNRATSRPIAICIETGGVDDCIGFDADAVRDECSDGCVGWQFAEDVRTLR